MAAVEQAIRDRLLTTTPVSDRIGERLHPRVLPQTPTLPAAVYQRVSLTAHHSHDGASDLDVTRLQIDCYADTYAQARETAVVIRATIDGLIRVWLSGLWVGGVLLDGMDDAYEDEARLWRARADYRVWHATELP